MNVLGVLPVPDTEAVPLKGCFEIDQVKTPNIESCSLAVKSQEFQSEINKSSSTLAEMLAPSVISGG